MKAQNHLEELLSNPWDYHEDCIDSAARDMIRLGRRHRLGMPDGRRTWICRGCQVALRPSINAKVRIRRKVMYVTCLHCGRINRKGPEFKRDKND